MRLIIEGMDRDNTRLNYIIREADVPKEATTIKTSWGKYIFRLTGEFKNKHVVKKNNINKDLEFILDYIPVGCPESPQTIIVEDGRIYSWANKERLDATLMGVFEIAGSFDEAYKQIIAEQSKFYH